MAGGFVIFPVLSLLGFILSFYGFFLVSPSRRSLVFWPACYATCFFLFNKVHLVTSQKKVNQVFIYQASLLPNNVRTTLAMYKMDLF